jgi:hypothetical protein
MTDNPPVAAAGPLPPLLINSSIADVEFGYVFDATNSCDLYSFILLVATYIPLYDLKAPPRS